MIYAECKFLTNDNVELTVRSPRAEDAEEMLDYIVAMCSETEFVGRYPEEVTETVDDVRKSIEEIADSDDSVHISVFNGSRIIGNASIFPYSKRLKIRHRSDFGIAILKPYWNQGIGRLLTNECLEMAKAMGYSMVELTALATNDAGIALYTSAGFEKWGELKGGSHLKNGVEDEIYMVKYL